MPKMTSTFSTSSKLLDRKWRDRAYRSHQEKMKSMKSNINSSPPPKFPHLMLRLKKLQVEEEKKASIDYDNAVLLSKMTKILKGRGKVDNWNGYESKSLNSDLRVRELQKIAEQNAVIAKSLRKVKPLYNVHSWEDDHKKMEYYKGIWSESTKEWGLSYNTSTGSRPYPESRTGRSHSSLASEEALTTDRASLADSDSSRYEKSSERENLAEDDAKLLFRGIKYLTPPIDCLNRTLIKRPRLLRILTRNKFQELFDLDLQSELRTVLGESYHTLVNALLGSSNMYDAMSMRTAIEEKDVASIVEIVCTRSSNSMTVIKDAYRKNFTNSLEDDIKTSFKGEDGLLFLLSLCRDGRSQDFEVDDELAQKDAHALFESGDGRWTSDTGVFVKVLEDHSFAQVRATLESFKQYNSGNSAASVVANECSAEFAKGVRRLEKCLLAPQTYFAEKFHNIMDHSNPEFIWLFVSRFDIDLQEIRKAYRKRYGHDLPNDIKSKFKGDIGNTLSQMASHSPVDKKDFGAKKQKITASHLPSPHKRSPVKRPEGKSKNLENAVRTNPMHNGKNKKPKNSDEKNDLKKKKTVAKPPPSRSGTVKPSKYFDVEKDMEKIELELAVWPTNQEPLIATLTGMNNEQRQQIKKKYMEKHKMDLKAVLDSKLGVDFEEIITALMMTPARYDAYCLYEAVVGLGAKECAIVGILGNRTAKEIKAINQQYLKAYGKHLDEDLKGDGSSPFANFALQLNKGERDETHNVNLHEAEEDAKKLYKNGKKLEMSDEVLEEMLTKRNRQQAKAIFEEYEKLAGHSLTQGIENAELGSGQDALLALVRILEDPLAFHAERLHETLDGPPIDEKSLIQLIVSRSEIDLHDIKRKYTDLYSEDLEEMVVNKCHGQYKYLLMGILKEK